MKDRKATTQKPLARRCIAKKSAQRKIRAATPIEQKIQSLIQLQRLANDIRRKTGRPTRPEWPLRKIPS